MNAPSSASGLQPFHRIDHFLARKPARVIEFGLVDGDLAHISIGMAADHQRGRERPGLAGDILHITHPHARFLEHLARHGLLDRFAWLDKARQRRVAPRGKARLAAKQELALPFDRHDRDRIDAREVLGLAIHLGALALPAALSELGGIAAARAEAVARMPIDQRTRAAICRKIRRRKRGHCRPGRGLAGPGFPISVGETAAKQARPASSRPRNTSSSAASASASEPQLSVPSSPITGSSPSSRSSRARQLVNSASLSASARMWSARSRPEPVKEIGGSAL